MLFRFFSGELYAADNDAYAHYDVRVSSALNSMQVQLCFADEVPAALSTVSDVAHRALEQLSINGKSVSARYRTRQKIYLPELAPGQCLQYRVNLSVAMTERSVPKAASHESDEILLRVSSWLWLPDVDSPAKLITLTFELPEGFNVSVPWRPIQSGADSRSFELGSSPADWPSLMAIGRFYRENISLADATLRLAVLGRLPVSGQTKIRDWIEHGAGSIMNIYGRFPLSSAQVLVVPTGKYDEPVPWGQVLRGGAPAIQLFVDASRPYEQFIQDWTLVHELAHFLHPNLGMGGSWLSEGLATYYQNIAQARAGTISALRAWQKLHNGFQRGIKETKKGRTLAYEALHMSDSHHYMRVYWSGAAIALLADFSLREKGQSLDEVLSRFQQCCLRPYRYWSSREFMHTLDDLSRTTVFSELYKEHVTSDQFPDLGSVYQQLGLQVKNGKLSFNKDANADRIRRQIMSAH